MRTLASMLKLVPILFLLGGAATSGCSDATGPRRGCCKICSQGKACGDTCIAKTDTCHSATGCACNA